MNAEGPTTEPTKYRQMLHQFAVERGVKALVFTSGDNLEVQLTDDFRDLTKLVNEAGLLLYLVIFKEKEHSKDLPDSTDQILGRVLEQEGFYVTDIRFINPP